MIWPLHPYLVRSFTGLNQRMSSGLKNMNLITADFLCTLNGWPLKTTLFKTILSGFTDKRLPVAINSCRLLKRLNNLWNYKVNVLKKFVLINLLNGHQTSLTNIKLEREETLLGQNMTRRQMYPVEKTFQTGNINYI